MEGSHDCDGNATCSDTEGSFYCMCNSGYTGSGVIGDCRGTYISATFVVVGNLVHS